MSVSYKIDVYHPTTGALQATITDYHWLKYTKKVNDFGMLQFQLNGAHRDLSKFLRNSLVIVSRKNTERGITSWQEDFYGVFLAQHLTNTNATSINGLVTLTLPSIDHKLTWRINDYPADNANFTTFSALPAETIMKRLVRYNFDTAYALVINGRSRSPTAIGIGITTNLGRGNTISYASSNAPILKDLQEIARIAGGDFGLVKSSTTQFNLEFYPNQLGTNRTSTIVFSLANGNMGDVEYELNWINEKSVAIVKGQGASTSRDVVIRTSPTYSVSGYDIETFVDARNVAKGTTNALNAAGDSELQNSVAEETFNFRVVQNPSYVYGLHYFLGDKVSAKYHTVSTTLKITSVTVEYKNSNPLETIDVEFTPIPF